MRRTGDITCGGSSGSGDAGRKTDDEVKKWSNKIEYPQDEVKDEEEEKETTWSEYPPPYIATGRTSLSVLEAPSSRWLPFVRLTPKN